MNTDVLITVRESLTEYLKQNSLTQTNPSKYYFNPLVAVWKLQLGDFTDPFSMFGFFYGRTELQVPSPFELLRVLGYVQRKNSQSEDLFSKSNFFDIKEFYNYKTVFYENEGKLVLMPLNMDVKSFDKNVAITFNVLNVSIVLAFNSNPYASVKVKTKNKERFLINFEDRVTHLIGKNFDNFSVSKSEIVLNNYPVKFATALYSAEGVLLFNNYWYRQQKELNPLFKLDNREVKVKVYFEMMQGVLEVTKLILL